MKRRAVEQGEEAVKRARAVRERERVRKGRWRDVSLMGGLLERETRGVVNGNGNGNGGKRMMERMWAGGLKGKGGAALWDWMKDWEGGGLSALWVGAGEEGCGLGVVYGVRYVGSELLMSVFGCHGGGMALETALCGWTATGGLQIGC